MKRMSQTKNDSKCKSKAAETAAKETKKDFCHTTTTCSDLQPDSKHLAHVPKKHPDSSKTSITTKIIAVVDVGFGNHLYIRGNGPGLSWDSGTVMKPISDTHWEWTCKNSATGSCFEFKVLLNDQIWSSGENYIAIGEVNEIMPNFC